MALNFCNNNSLSAITALPASISGGALTLLQTQTASSSATIDFTSNIDSTYDAYMFKLYNIHPSANSYLQFQTSTDGGSSFGVTATTTNFRAYHNEAGNDTDLTYYAEHLAQSTNFQNIFLTINTGNDESACSTIVLYNPSNTTFVKHFIARTTGYGQSAYNMQYFTAGYFNTTSAVNGVQFKMSTGNMDSGVIKLYGIS